MEQRNEAEPRKHRGRPRTRTPKKRQTSGRGVPMKGQSREIVCKVREYFDREKANKGPLIPVNNAIQRTADALKIHKNTVLRVCKEKELKEIQDDSNSQLSTPGKQRKREKTVTKLDTFQEDAIRRHVYQYYIRKEYPTLKKLLSSLENEELFNGSLSSLRNVLKGLGFTWRKFSGRKVIMERSDVAAWRCRFLRQIKDENFDNIIWLDETWVNAGHCLKQGWTDESLQGTMLTPIGKGERLIICHAGSSKGFVPNSLLLFKSKKTGDYHEDMDHDKFFGWCSETLLNNLEEPAVIVMDNAPYHSKQIDKAPTSKDKKADILAWLDRKNIQSTTDLKKSELLELVKWHKPQNKRYFVDELIESRGHKVIRLPPYHCHLNAIELIWAQVKGYVAENNKMFTLKEVERLTKDGFNRITAERWEQVVDHTKKVIIDAWNNEGLMEEAVEEMIISVGDSSSSEDDNCSEDDNSDDDPMEGIRELSFEDY